MLPRGKSGCRADFAIFRLSWCDRQFIYAKTAVILKKNCFPTIERLPIPLSVSIATLKIKLLMIAVATDRNWKPVIKEFEAVVGKNGVVQRREELLVYECDGLASYRQRPALVVLPRTTEEVANAVKICDRNSIPWVARGAGTGLSGGALPVENCVLIVTALMRKILKVDLENQQVVVQPGVINNWVTQAVSGAGFYYAPDPSREWNCDRIF